MFPRMTCHACAVLWVDLGGDADCWCCGRPGARTGDHVIAGSGHTYAHAKTYAIVAGELVSVDLAAAS